MSFINSFAASISQPDVPIINPAQGMTDEQRLAHAYGYKFSINELTAPVQKRPQNCGTGYCSCIECVMEPAPVQESIEDFKKRIAAAIESMPFGDTAASFAVFIRNFK